MSYINDIQSLDDLTVRDIIRVSYRYIPDSYVSCPWTYNDNQGRTLEHGTAVLETEELCCAYMAAYGQMHYHKLMHALNDPEFPYSSLADGFEIYDWGCGQGIGSVAVFPFLL